MKVLVTGGAGLIGSHLVDLLLQRGYEVRVLDSLALPTHLGGPPSHLRAEAEFHWADVADAEAVRRALLGVQAVCHLAAAGGFSGDMQGYMRDNSWATAGLLDAIRNYGLPIEKIVVASSVAVYGEGLYRCAEHGRLHPPMRSPEQLGTGQWELLCPHCAQPLEALLTTEDTGVSPETVYSLSKYDEERLALSFERQTGIPVAPLRFFLTYGPRQSVSNPYTGICSIFATRLLTGKSVVIYEDGRQTRDFVAAGDVARACLLALEHPDAHGRPYNVGTGRPTTILEFARTLAEVLGKGERLETELGGKYRLGDVRHLAADITALSALGFTPQYALHEGLQAYAAWIGALSGLQDRFQEAEQRLMAQGVVRSRGSA